MEMSNLSDAEFKILVLRMLKEPWLVRLSRLSASLQTERFLA